MYFYLNNIISSNASACIHVNDRGLLLADGLFETFKIQDGQPLYLNEHLKRLRDGANLLAIPLTVDAHTLNLMIADLIEINHYHGTLSARLTLTRGPGPRGISPPTTSTPTLILTIEPYNYLANLSYSLRISEFRKNEYSPLSPLKSLSYTENILARMDALKHGSDDALFLNTSGLVCGTTMCNFFLIKNDTLITPPISDGILPGIMRSQTLSYAESIGIKTSEISITLDECLDADAAFITNSLIDIKMVSQINGVMLNVHHPIADLLMNRFNTRVTAE